MSASAVQTPALIPREFAASLPPAFQAAVFEELVREKMASELAGQPAAPGHERHTLWVPAAITSPPHVTPEAEARMRRAIETLDNAFDPRERFKNVLTDEDRG